MYDSGMRKSCMRCLLPLLLLLFTTASGMRQTENADRNLCEIRQQNTLDVENVQKAKEEACRSVIGILLAETSADKGSYYGSGVLWDTDETGIIIAASRHLLEQGDSPCVFLAGEDILLPAKLLGWSAQWDIGFIHLAYEDMKVNERQKLCVKLRYVRLHQRLYESLDEVDSLFAVGVEYGKDTLVIRDGMLLERTRYMEEFGTDMLELALRVQPGMSGGGIFDAYGNFIGLIGGGYDSRSAAVAMEDVNGAYLEVCGRRRDTALY